MQKAQTEVFLYVTNDYMSRDQSEHFHKFISWGEFTELDQHKLWLGRNKHKQNEISLLY